MTTLELTAPQATLAAGLKAATTAAHEDLDGAIMAAKPFASRENYGGFVKVQRAFHREIDALYSDAGLDALLPDLAGRRRLDLIDQDLADLGLEPLPETGAPAFGSGAADLPRALGWLYVAEGSNLGAAFLLKEAKALGLSEDFGARHLAAAPEGRGLHWRTFTAALNAVELSDEERDRVIAGAHEGFACVRAAVREMLGR